MNTATNMNESTRSARAITTTDDHHYAHKSKHTVGDLLMDALGGGRVAGSVCVSDAMMSIADELCVFEQAMSLSELNPDILVSALCSATNRLRVLAEVQERTKSSTELALAAKLAEKDALLAAAAEEIYRLTKERSRPETAEVPAAPKSGARMRAAAPARKAKAGAR